MKILRSIAAMLAQMQTHNKVWVVLIALGWGGLSVYAVTTDGFKKPVQWGDLWHHEETIR